MANTPSATALRVLAIQQAGIQIAYIKAGRYDEASKMAPQLESTLRELQPQLAFTGTKDK